MLASPPHSDDPVAIHHHIVHLAIDIFEVHVLPCGHSPIPLDKNPHSHTTLIHFHEVGLPFLHLHTDPP